MSPSVEHRVRIGRLELHLQCNILSCLFGFALFTNCVQIAVGPLAIIFLLLDGDSTP